MKISLDKNYSLIFRIPYFTVDVFGRSWVDKSPLVGKIDIDSQGPDLVMRSIAEHFCRDRDENL